MPRRSESGPPSSARDRGLLGSVAVLLAAGAFSLSPLAGAQEAACTPCHAGPAAAIAASPHREVSTHAALRGCATCHVGSAPHALRARTGGGDAGFRDPPGALARSCALCHPKRPASCSETQEGWSRGRCRDCHEIHGPARLARPYPGYAGDGSCRACHAPVFEGTLPHTPRPRNAQDPPHGGCESCHGPSEGHRSDPKVHTPVRAAGPQACEACHQGDHALVGIRATPHARRAVTCLACHVPEPDPPPAESLCRACHPTAVAQFRLPSHHRLHEGRISCVDCHDPHGGGKGLRDEELRQETCVGCHSEKGGPFVFDHEGERLRGCLSCHRPHGSPNPRLLTHSRSEDLCGSCHPTPACNHLHDPGSIWRDCLSCHTAVHGSNWSHELFR